MTKPLLGGTVALVDFGTTVGREQSGVRPAVVVSSPDFTRGIDRMVIVLPCTKTDRGWTNHVALAGETGLSRPTFAMTEQVRSIAVERVLRVLGRVDNHTLNELEWWLRVWIRPAA